MKAIRVAKTGMVDAGTVKVAKTGMADVSATGMAETGAVEVVGAVRRMNMLNKWKTVARG